MDGIPAGRNQTCPPGLGSSASPGLSGGAGYDHTCVLRESRVKPEDIIGLSIDFTACTVMPVDREGTPLCIQKEWEHVPHAWPKLWKHHAAQEEANICTRIAKERGETFLSRYGGKVSSEWMIPKLMEILKEAPEVYEEADRFVEAADWVVLRLTGQEKRSGCAAGYKAFWNKKEGYPSPAFFQSTGCAPGACGAGEAWGRGLSPGGKSR